jgi:hypothetical protein
VPPAAPGRGAILQAAQRPRGRDHPASVDVEVLVDLAELVCHVTRLPSRIPQQERGALPGMVRHVEVLVVVPGSASSGSR